MYFTVSFHTQGVEVGLLVGVVGTQVRVGLLGVLLLILAGLGVLVSEDEMEFVVLATLVRPKHDGVGSPIHKLILWIAKKRRHNRKTSYAEYITHDAL